MRDAFPKPAPDFSDPLGLILACHQRMLGHCELLERLAEHMKHSGADEDARQAARKAHQYFSTAAQHHHDDEEQDVFPRVARASEEMAALVQRLQQDHERIDAAWNDLGPMLADPRNIGDFERFAGLVDGFCKLYREHIRVEEAEFFDPARQVLGSEDLKAIGAAMQARRQPKSS